MKKTKLIIFMILLILMVTGCTNSTSQGDYEIISIEEQEVEIDAQGHSVEFVRSTEFVEEDRTLMGLVFSYTNDSGATAVPEDYIFVSAFQNGVELTKITYCGQRMDDAAMSDSGIQTGTTTDVIWLFEKVDNSEISVEVSDGQRFILDSNGMKLGAVDKISIKREGSDILYTRHEFANESGEDIVIIHFTFENKCDEYMCLHDAANFTAYQDGMEMDGFYLDSELYDNSWREIGKGKTLECAISYRVKRGLPIQLRVSPITGGSFNRSDYQEQILENQ